MMIEEAKSVGRLRLLLRVGRIFQAVEWAVRVGAQQQAALAAGAGSSVLLNGDERIDGSLQKDVVPAAPINAGGVDAGGLGFGVGLGPKIVVLRMLEKRIE